MSIDISIDVSEQLNKLDDFLESAKSVENTVLIYNTPYAIYVEYPTEYDDKKPPFDPLFEWVQRNITTDNPVETTYRIQQYIFENGTEGVFFLNRTKSKYENGEIDNIIRNYDGDIENAPENIIQSILEQMKADSQDIIEKEAYDTGELHESAIVELNPDSELIA